ncbi:hypothetical protein C8F01DRAFT_1081696 [Mycena amicta]|nr:hypothetical protein C8F01DRAFT_1081696 [Mycena amicta]
MVNRHLPPLRNIGSRVGVSRVNGGGAADGRGKGLRDIGFDGGIRTHASIRKEHALANDPDLDNVVLRLASAWEVIVDRGSTLSAIVDIGSCLAMWWTGISVGKRRSICRVICQRRKLPSASCAVHDREYWAPVNRSQECGNFSKSLHQHWLLVAPTCNVKTRSNKQLKAQRFKSGRCRGQIRKHQAVIIKPDADERERRGGSAGGYAGLQSASLLPESMQSPTLEATIASLTAMNGGVGPFFMKSLTLRVAPNASTLSTLAAYPCTRTANVTHRLPTTVLSLPPG